MKGVNQSLVSHQHLRRLIYAEKRLHLILVVKKMPTARDAWKIERLLFGPAEDTSPNQADHSKYSGVEQW